jgi:hypothetical protein
LIERLRFGMKKMCLLLLLLLDLIDFEAWTLTDGGSLRHSSRRFVLR